MEEFTLKKCHNRGNARIWIEGNRLFSAGFVKGSAYVKRFTGNESDGRVLVLDFACTENGRVTFVAGTDSRPIIDICSKEITGFLYGADEYRVELDSVNRVITIEPVKV
jgi:hypothetical protein